MLQSQWARNEPVTLFDRLFPSRRAPELPAEEGEGREEQEARLAQEARERAVLRRQLDLLDRQLDIARRARGHE